MTDIQRRIADILTEHAEVFDRFTQRHVCTCEKWASSDMPAEHESHVAGVLVSELPATLLDFLDYMGSDAIGDERWRKLCSWLENGVGEDGLEQEIVDAYLAFKAQT